MKTPISDILVLFALLALSTINSQLSTCFAQGTAFTYQGRLNSSGGPAGGSYDLTFTLFPTNATGVAIAGPVTNAATAVTNGLFTVTLDFGGGMFAGSTNRWLEVGVRTNGIGSFTTLTPRQQITPTPYAVFANTASNLSGTVLNASLPASPNFPGTVLATSFQSGGSGSFIAGAANNAGGLYDAIGGGEFNTNSAGYATIGGGYNNKSATAQYITIGGGRFNIASANDATIGGGVGNSNNAAAATIGGGYSNIASSNNATIGGGQFNNVTGQNATVGGGQYNTAGGNSATVPGGSGNLASGDYSFAAGQQAQATNQGAFVWADSQNAPFASTTTNQFNIRAGGGVRFVTGGTGMTVDGQPLLAGTVGASQIDDGGAAVYQMFQQTVQSVGGDSSIPFADVLPVKATNGVTPSFTFTVNGSAFGSVVGFSGDEGISQPCAYAVEVLSSGAAVNPDAQLGLNGQLTYTRNGRSTSFGGLVTACTLAASNGASLLYTFRLESPLATMSLSTDYHIYQAMTAPTVAATVYLNATASTAAQSLTASYTAHDNLIQFGETDLNFFSRILEYEGIFYFFNQSASPPSLVLGDSPSAYLSSPNSPFPYYGNLNTNVPSGAEYIQTFQKAYHQSTLASTVSAYNFTTPTAVPSATVSGAEGVGSLFEFGSSSVQTTAYNQLIAQVRQDHQTAARAAIAGSGTAPDLHAGYTFALNDQTGAGLGNSYLVTSIHHAGFVRVTNGVSTVFYGNQFRAIPASLNYRPPLATPKPQAQPCIAVVTGPSGQEIYVDQYGRVKVQFKWDRYGANNDTSSAWIRMASPMAGANGRGMMFLPRIGDEVLVSFVEGDPDQPVITGSLYNANNTPPYTLPSSETVSTIRSTGTPAQPSQINEIKFDDKAANQTLTIQAAKDLSIKAANNTTLSVGNNLSVTATGSATLAAGTSLSVTATGNATLSSGGGLSIQAGTQTTFSGPVSIGALTATSVSAGSQSVTGGMNIDQANLNSGTVSANALTFGAGSGEGIGSQRTSGANQYDLVFYTANAARMSILNNGYVGIGTSLPTAPLNVQGNQTGSFGNATVLIANTNSTSSSGPALRVQSNGTGQYGALSVSANNLTGPIAEFGNANTWVATIANDGTISATAFNTTSDRNAKANFAPINPTTVLAKVAALPISEWNFKADPADQKHLGPMAQDFHTAFDLNGADDKHIATVDEEGVALAAIQGLNQRLNEKDAQIQKLNEKADRLDSLEKRLNELEHMVQSLAATK